MNYLTRGSSFVINFSFITKLICKPLFYVDFEVIVSSFLGDKSGCVNMGLIISGMETPAIQLWLVWCVDIPMLYIFCLWLFEQMNVTPLCSSSCSFISRNHTRINRICGGSQFPSWYLSWFSIYVNKLWDKKAVCLRCCLHHCPSIYLQKCEFIYWKLQKAMHFFPKLSECIEILKYLLLFWYLVRKKLCRQSYQTSTSLMWANEK